MLDRFEQFTYSISNIAKHIMKIERKEMEKYGLRGSYAQYLVVLAGYPEGITSTKLSELCDRDKAAISRIVCEMEKRGLVTREGSEGGTYRAKLSLTEEGHKAAQFVCDRAEIAVSLAGKGLGEDDRKIFYGALAIFEANLRRISRDGLPEKGDRTEK